MTAHGPQSWHCFVHEDGVPMADLPDWDEIERVAEMVRRSPLARGRAGGASPLSRCASQPKALIPNARSI